MTPAVDPLFDIAALSSYLKGLLPGSGSFEVERHRAGHSNETFFVRRSGHEWVLRRPPRGAFLPTAHDVLREHRVLEALADTPVRAPRPLFACDDASVIGAPFFVMEKVDGLVLREEPPPPSVAPGRLSEDLVDALLELHSVDQREAGLEGWARPDGYLERQLRRWSGQLELTVPLTRPLPDLAAAGEWLAAHLPSSGPASIVHGDYKLDNVVVAPDGKVRAILDWEMSTIGDPLADVGWLLSFWHDEAEEDQLGLAGATRHPGFPPREELLARYARGSKCDLSAFSWYRVLALWKLAILLEGSYARHLAGQTDDPFFERLRAGVPGIARRALEVAEAA